MLECRTAYPDVRMLACLHACMLDAPAEFGGKVTMSREIEPECKSFCRHRSCTFTEVARWVPAFWTLSTTRQHTAEHRVAISEKDANVSRESGDFRKRHERPERERNRGKHQTNDVNWTQVRRKSETSRTGAPRRDTSISRETFG